MIAALTLLFAAQTTPQAEIPPIEMVIEAANQEWLALPAATSTFVATPPEGEEVSIREARDERRNHFEIWRDGLLLFASFSDGKTNTALDFSKRLYGTAPGRGFTRVERQAKADPLPPRKSDYAEVRLDLGQGLVVRVDPPVPIVSDEQVTVNGIAVRRLVGKQTKPYRDADHPGGTVEITALIDVAGGWLRQFDASFNLGEATGQNKTGTTRFRFVCEPAVAADEPFAFDTSRLTDWTKTSDPFRLDF